MIPQKYAFLTFNFFLSGMMSFIVTGVATVRAVGLTVQVPHLWITAWPISWPIAFVAVTLVAPIARKLSNMVVGGGGR
jgi:hypothetical protein